jgi:hypothetical protein
VNGTLAALAAMRPRNAGSIVQVGSALAYRGIALQSAYCAAKFAVRGFTDSLRTELLHERSRIRVTMVQLPAMNTPQFDWARNKLEHEYRPVGTVFDPDVASDAVSRAVQEGPRELWVGDSAIQAITGQMAAPVVMDRILSRASWEGQIDEPPNPHGPDNLFDSVPGHQGARGRFGAIAKRHATIVDPARVREALAGTALFALGVFAASKLGRRPRGLS